LIKVAILHVDNLERCFLEVEIQMVDEGISQKIAIYMKENILLTERWVSVFNLIIWNASISLMSDPSISK
jgi:hypothetical protein